MNLTQVTKDEDFVSFEGFYDSKVLFYKYLINKFTKDPERYIEVTNEFKKRNFNRMIVKTCLMNFMNQKQLQLRKRRSEMTKEEMDLAIKEFEYKFLTGEYVSNPEQYINL